MEHYFTNNLELASEIRKISYENNGMVFTFFSDLGVFSKDRIDFGSRALVETILKNEKDIHSILDVGCGYGFIGIVLAKKYDAELLSSDVNKRALHLCERNIKEHRIRGKTIESNIYEHIEGTFDMIVTNPPIRAGKKVVLEMLKDARYHLNKVGKLWFVIRKDQGAKSVMKELENYYTVEVVEKKKGFFVICAKLIDTFQKD